MDIININDNSNKLFYIGGVVRDELLGRQSFDVDITYVGNAIEYCARFGEVIQENPDFGTIRVNVDGREVDFASTRAETYPHKGHLPVVTEIGCPLKDDIIRRDFTVNALAKSVTTGEIVDYTSGLEDLKNKKLRVLHDESFIDDPTRIIRGLKFSVRFGFELDEHTRNLQENYLANINYDMSYKRVKKELIETFNLNSQKAFEKFINEKIYKLVTEKDVELPKINIENMINDYGAERIWLVYAGVVGDLSRLPLTKIEQKILDDIPAKKHDNDFELYKAFENSSIETVLLYAILRDEAGARHYLDDLRNIKIEITGKDLQAKGIKPSPKYAEIFDEVLKAKLKNPQMTKEDEFKIAHLKNF
ncbi:MAG: CCA tRNA nucleotidyltransferase [Candidatus Gastranaerophilaceae bacterium]